MNEPNCQPAPHGSHWPMHVNCRCELVFVRRTPDQDAESPESLGAKLAAKILLSDGLRRIVVPSAEEMRGLALLARDDEMPTSLR